MPRPPTFQQEARAVITLRPVTAARAEWRLELTLHGFGRVSSSTLVGLAANAGMTPAEVRADDGFDSGTYAGGRATIETFALQLRKAIVLYGGKWHLRTGVPTIEEGAPLLEDA